ncbi:hypothetical protein I0J99_01315 [Sinorhizobium meliloti]|uniref:hypothetical protein n=1 Tax=Rhizobium meliloti TaxID=382 RepID=UPI000D1DD972|nr:hypothetical protein [Sinorhizobium meliloti]QPI25902.1 hypothetical protein I0J99_01315 [Sinorhizobium meliloti]RMI11895.1 hypothetical protein DA101_011665 [Sinorhizobium meliloti]WQP01194.1 hypothetical protein U8C41_16285 [Sinorhizobium meliloti]
MATQRYDVRKNEDEYWSVIDIFTGEPAWFHGVELRCLEVDEIDGLVDWLNHLYAQRIGTLKQP